MIEFYNMKTKSFTKFYKTESEPVIDDLLKSSFTDINAIMSYLSLNEKHKLVKNIRAENKFSDQEIILLILFHSSINAYGVSVYECFKFEQKEILKLIDDMYLGFSERDIFDSIVNMIYELAEKEVKENKLSIYSFIKGQS